MSLTSLIAHGDLLLCRGADAVGGARRSRRRQDDVRPEVRRGEALGRHAIVSGRDQRKREPAARVGGRLPDVEGDGAGVAFAREQPDAEVRDGPRSSTSVPDTATARTGCIDTSTPVRASPGPTVTVVAADSDVVDGANVVW